MNKEALVTLSLQELDNTLFHQLTTRMAAQYPDDHRRALKVAMLVADGVMEEFEALAKRQVKSGAAKAAAEARWAGSSEPSTNLTTGITAPNVVGAPVLTSSPKKRHRRTKAEIAADAARAAGQVDPAAPLTPAEQQAAADYGAPFLPPGAPPPMPPNWVGPDGGPNPNFPAPATPPAVNIDAAVAAASGSPLSNVPPPPPLQIPTFGQP
jgi:hypothetical protein